MQSWENNFKAVPADREYKDVELIRLSQNNGPMEGCCFQGMYFVLRMGMEILSHSPTRFLK